MLVLPPHLFHFLSSFFFSFLLLLFQGFRSRRSPLRSYFGYFSPQQLRTPGRANDRSNNEKHSWLQSMLGLRGVSKLLNYLDEEFISKSYFALVPESHLHLRAVSFLGMSSEVASLHISCFKQGRASSLFIQHMAAGKKRCESREGRLGPASTPNRRAAPGDPIQP